MHQATNRQPIRPTVKHSITLGKGNKHLLDAQTLAYSAALNLAEEGFSIIRVEVGDRRPVVTVEPCHRTANLRRASKVIQQGAHGSEYVMAAPYHDCQVEWVERGSSQFSPPIVAINTWK